MILEPDCKNLIEMLQYRRPHGSKSERKFINRFIRPLGCEEDDAGNYYLRIGDNPKILWSAHTDSVHRLGGKQRIAIRDNIIKLAEGEASNCLGADNAAGIWILRELIRHNVPGLYVFHRQEESGGVGSSHFAKHNTHLLEGISAAIAFDRRKTHSIITHQWGGRTASDAFANSLAEQLGMNHKPDDGGTFTDTASYSEIIPECTNVSVGFESEHTSFETLNYEYLLELRNAVVQIDQDALKYERDPIRDDPYDDYHGSYGGFYSGYEYGSTRSRPRRHGVRDSYEATLRLVKAYPNEIADFLEMSGVTTADLDEHIWDSYDLYNSSSERKAVEQKYDKFDDPPKDDYLFEGDVKHEPMDDDQCDTMENYTKHRKVYG